MITVKFDNESYDAYVVNYQIGEAEIKTSLINIPYADGQLDLTDYYGTVRYKNRPITINMRIFGSEDIVSIYHEISTSLHGKVMKIEFSDDDEDWYWYGRCAVGQGTRTNNYAYDFAIVVDAEPYQYQDIRIEKSFTTEGYIDCVAGGMIVSPTITTDASATFQLGEVSSTYSAGTRIAEEFKFTDEINRLFVTPSDSVNVIIEYTRGRL